MVAAGMVRWQPSYISPESAAQVMDHGNETWYKSDMRETVKHSHQGGGQGGGDQKRKAEQQRVVIKSV